MTELSQTFSVPPVPHVPQACKKKKKDRIGQKCVPQTHVHTFLCIAEILMWKKAVGLLKDCVKGSREQAGGFIEDRQEGTWNLHQC